MKKAREKEKEEPGTISRREFLKDAGLVVGGAALGSIGLANSCATEKTVTQTTTASVIVTKQSEVLYKAPVSQGYLVYDSQKCTGCTSCMLSCSLVHEGKSNLSLSRIQIAQDPFGQFPEDLEINVCRQCVYPACVEACPVGACYVDTTNGNVRVIDEKKCTGCKLCIDACPHAPHRIVWNPEKKVAMKCDLCINTPFRKDKGGPAGAQACVDICPMKALKLVKDTPKQTDSTGYDVNMRNEHWAVLVKPSL